MNISYRHILEEISNNQSNMNYFIGNVFYINTGVSLQSDIRHRSSVCLHVSLQM